MFSSVPLPLPRLPVKGGPELFNPEPLLKLSPLAPPLESSFSLLDGFLPVKLHSLEFEISLISAFVSSFIKCYFILSARILDCALSLPPILICFLISPVRLDPPS